MKKGVSCVVKEGESAKSCRGRRECQELCRKERVSRVVQEGESVKLRVVQEGESVKLRVVQEGESVKSYEGRR